MIENDSSGPPSQSSSGPPSQSSSSDGAATPRFTFDDDLAANQAVEKRLLWKELAGFGLIAAIVVVRQLWLL